jgi:Flp pilus assembly protein TadD
MIEEVPDYPVGWLGLGDLYLRQGKIVDLEKHIKRLGQQPELGRAALELEIKLAAVRHGAAAAWQLLERADREFPGALEPLQGLCQVLFEHGDAKEAERALKELTRRAPDDASAHHNLGLLYRRCGRLSEAAQALGQALKIQPDRASTKTVLAEVMEEQQTNAVASGRC